MCKRTATLPNRLRIAVVTVTACLASAPFCAHAQALRLRADAVAEVQAPAPTGLIVLQGEDKQKPWVNAEALVWAGARPDANADVLVLAVRVRAPHGLGELRAGRFVFTAGAIRPVQMDGASALARAPWGSIVEAAAGLPVVPSFAARPYDWMAAGRIAQNMDSHAVVGLSYVQRRERGEVSNEEVGADFAAVPVRWLDVAARSSYDLSSPGVADALVSAAARADAFRFEVFGTHRSPSRLLPATSLFSVLGDFPSDTVGATVRWRAAPRLDVLASGAGQSVGGAPGGNGWLRTLLRLDDRGDGSLGVELRRQDVSTARWTGARYVGTHPMGRVLRFSAELEFVFPDAPRGRGIAWPWGLLALACRPGKGWEAAVAAEASATPDQRFALVSLLRLSRSMGLP